jgi:hypothetical protein
MESSRARPEACVTWRSVRATRGDDAELRKTEFREHPCLKSRNADGRRAQARPRRRPHPLPGAPAAQAPRRASTLLVLAWLVGAAAFSTRHENRAGRAPPRRRPRRAGPPAPSAPGRQHHAASTHDKRQTRRSLWRPRPSRQRVPTGPTAQARRLGEPLRTSALARARLVVRLANGNTRRRTPTKTRLTR